MERLRPWLARVGWRVVLDERKRRRPGAVGEEFDHPDERAPDPSEQAEAAELAAHVRARIEALARRSRPVEAKALRWSWLEGLSREEVVRRLVAWSAERGEPLTREAAREADRRVRRGVRDGFAGEGWPSWPPDKKNEKKSPPHQVWIVISVEHGEPSGRASGRWSMRLHHTVLPAWVLRRRHGRACVDLIETGGSTP